MSVCGQSLGICDSVIGTFTPDGTSLVKLNANFRSDALIFYFTPIFTLKNKHSVLKVSVKFN